MDIGDILIAFTVIAIIVNVVVIIFHKLDEG